MNRGVEIPDSIPIELILEIFSRLPSKSIVRFRCVCKLWGSMLHLPYFSDLFLTRSSARPHLLFSLNECHERSFFSSTQPYSPYEKSSSSLVVAAGFHVKISEDVWMEFSGYASGLICFLHTHISKVHVICNPSTGQCASLPELRMYVSSYSFLGFDPIDKQFKVLFKFNDDHRILTLGTGEMSWRNIQCPMTHSPYSKGMCLNGVLYYLAETYHPSDVIDETPYSIIVCFDVRSEKYTFIEVESLNLKKLINYKGKLGGIILDYANADRSGTFELCLCVLEDVEKQEWSKHVYTFTEDKIVDLGNVFVVGVTATGEIVLSMRYASIPFYVFYFSPERSTIQSVEIQGFGENYDENYYSVSVFVDYVEDLNFYKTESS